jgi:hypothetical protein
LTTLFVIPLFVLIDVSASEATVKDAKYLKEISDSVAASMTCVLQPGKIASTQDQVEKVRYITK